MSREDVRKSALRRYIVFRIKAIEFLDLIALFNVLRRNQMRQSEMHEQKSKCAAGLAPLVSFLSFRPPSFVADSIKTVLISWFALFIDKNGLDVISLWCEVFPAHASQTNAAWKRMEPAWEIIREFRDRAGFHADKPLRFFDARYRLRKEWSTVATGLDEFKRLLDFFIMTAEQKELGDELGSALDLFLDEIEKRHGGAKFKREQVKAYLMIPESRPGG